MSNEDLAPKQGAPLGTYSPEDAARQAEEDLKKRLAAAKGADQRRGGQIIEGSSHSDSQKARDGKDGAPGKDGVAGRDGAPAPEEKSKKWYDNTAVRVGLVALAIVTLPYSIYAVAAVTVVAAAGAIVYGAAVGVYKGVKAIASWFKNRKKDSYQMNPDVVERKQETARGALREDIPHREQEQQQAVHHDRVDPAAAIRRSSSVSVRSDNAPPAPPPRVIVVPQPTQGGRGSSDA